MPSFLHYKSVSVLLVGLFIWLTFNGLSAGSRRDAAEKSLRDLEARIRTLEQDNEKLARLASQSQSESFLEKEARLKLNYKAPDEQVAFVYRQKDPIASSSMEEIDSESGFTKVWSWVKNLF